MPTSTIATTAIPSENRVLGVSTGILTINGAPVTAEDETQPLTFNIHCEADESSDDFYGTYQLTVDHVCTEEGFSSSPPVLIIEDDRSILKFREDSDDGVVDPAPKQLPCPLSTMK